jgi:hypothetical protein
MTPTRSFDFLAMVHSWFAVVCQFSPRMNANEPVFVRRLTDYAPAQRELTRKIEHKYQMTG